MKRQILTLFLTLVLLISVGGVVSIVGAASHVTPAQVQKPTVKEAAGPFVGSIHSNVYHYPGCYEVKHIKPANLIWFNTSEEARAAGYRPCLVCNPP
ncbi:MAG: Ada metal-binding domain-containing protein [Halobacteriota archaeon]